MIASDFEYEEANRRLRILESGLSSLCAQLAEENPPLLPIARRGYDHQIQRIREEIERYRQQASKPP